jgi:nucleosome binding factor SPN SPT16 subunit
MKKRTPNQNPNYGTIKLSTNRGSINLFYHIENNKIELIPYEAGCSPFIRTFTSGNLPYSLVEELFKNKDEIRKARNKRESLPGRCESIMSLLLGEEKGLAILDEFPAREEPQK